MVVTSAYSRQQFLHDLHALGLSQRKFADTVGSDPGTVYHWGQAPKSPFPRWVPMLLAAWCDNKRLGDELADLSTPASPHKQLERLADQMAALRQARKQNNL